MNLLPENLSSVIEDMQRQIRDLQVAQRVGLNQLRFCRSTGSAFPAVYGTYEYGVAGNTWVDDLGAVGTGYPTITMVTPKRNLVLIGYRPVDVGNAPGFRTNSVQVAVKIDATGGYINRQYVQSNIDRMYVPVTSAGVIDLPAGVSHTFTIGAAWVDVNPAAGTLPLLSDAYIIVLPLSA